MNSEPLSVCQTRSRGEMPQRSEMLLNASGEDGAGGGGTALSEGPEQQAAAHLASGVLDGGQIEDLRLRPVAGDIIAVLGIGGELLKNAPRGPYAGAAFFSLVFELAFFHKPVRAPDAPQNTKAEGQ